MDKKNPAFHMINGGTATNSSMGFSSDGAGAVSVDLSSSTLAGVVVENAATLELKGQSTATAWADVGNSPSALVVYHQAPASTYNLTAINFTHKNNRRVVLGIRKDENLPGVTFSFPDVGSNEAGVGPEWRLIAQIESTPAIFNFVGTTLNLIGGIVTNRELAAPSGGQLLHIYREQVPLGLMTKTPRRAWTEGFKLDD
ncbi:MAG: hypothetical protein ACR2OZ_07345 [Verrucomicrobiales bacterium]